MDIIDVKIEEIIPYDKNPRSNDKAVKFVKKSIKDFGFKVPLVIDKNNVIVTGHTRYKSALELGFDSLPCVIADDLTEKQINAFRIVDNKVGEMATWNIKLLQEEMRLLPEYNFTDFGFEYNAVGESNNGSQRAKTVEGYNLDYYDEDFSENKWGIPEIDGIVCRPSGLMGFNYARTSKDYDKTIHFYLDDYQFERIWNNPEKYVDILKNYDAVLTPDFSLYLNMPLAMQLWNVYRSRMVGQILQNNGINVIPTVSWALEDSFEFCFDGLPTNSTLSVSTIGVKKGEAYDIWVSGMDELIKRCKPKILIVYGGKVEYDYGNIEVIYYNSDISNRRKGV